MADQTGIEWTDATWNPVVGCSIISPGCKHCYAMREAARLERMGGKVGAKYAGLTKVVNGKAVWTGEVREYSEALDQPLRWKRPRRIFVNSMSDLFHEDLPDHAIDRVFAIMASAPQHTFQVLTKRADRMAAYLAGYPQARWMGAMSDLQPRPAGHGVLLQTKNGGVLPNVWLGASVEDQKRADERCQHLRAIAELYWLTWISYEPAVGLVNWTGWEFVRWLVSGGESGDGARAWHPLWYRVARDFCAMNGIAYLHKQNGAYGPTMVNLGSGLPVVREFRDFQQWVDKASGWVRRGDICVDTGGNVLLRGADFMAARDENRFPVAILANVGKKRAGRLLDGALHDAYPVATAGAADA